MLHGYLDNEVSIPLSTAGLLVGEYNHIFGLQNVGELQQSSQVRACTVKEYHTEYNYFAQGNPPGWDEETGTFYPRPDDDYDCDDDYWHIDEERLLDFQKQPRGLELKLALGEKYARSSLTGYVLGTSYSETYDHGGPQSLGSFNPLSDYIGETAPDETTGQLFHRDKSGKATFTAEEAKAASIYIASMDLDGRIMAAVQKKRFELTQELKEVNDYYCNESTYVKTLFLSDDLSCHIYSLLIYIFSHTYFIRCSNLSLLYVTGLVRFDPSIEATSTSVSMPRENLMPGHPRMKGKRDWLPQRNISRRSNVKIFYWRGLLNSIKINTSVTLMVPVQNKFG